MTVNACEIEAGKDNVLHLAINSGTDLALFNALLTYVADKGWVDKDFIAASTNDFDKAVAANKTSVEDAAKITGLKPEDIVKAAEWIAHAEGGGKRRRTMFSYEKGLIWGNDNYRTNAALVNLALATGNIGRPGGGCVRMGGHQEGYVRPSDGFIGRPAPYVDQLLIGGKGGVHHIWACDHYKTTLNAMEFKRVYKERTDKVKDAMSNVAYGDRKVTGRRHRRGDQGRRPVRRRRRHHPDQDRAGVPCLAAGRDLGRDEPHLDERRAPHAADRALHGPARPVDARLPDRGAHRQQHGARVPRAWARTPRPTSSRASTGRPKKTPSWTAITKTPAAASSSPMTALRAMGTNGFQEPATASRTARSSAPSASTPTASSAARTARRPSSRRSGAACRRPASRRRRTSSPFLINNGRTNHVWQNAYLDQQNELIVDRWPYPFIQMNPDDMAELGVKEGDLVEVYNDNGSTQAMVYPTATAKRKETFMLFAYPTGRPGQRRLEGRERVHHPQLQADLGRHPEDLQHARQRRSPVVQVAGIQRLAQRTGSHLTSGGRLRPPAL